jgi:uncharacterized protein (TIGR00369 family)
MELVMDVAELNRFLRREFPQVADDFTVAAASEGSLSLAFDPGPQHLRPGGTVSGPAMFGLADVAMYLAILSKIGPEALTVTTNCSIDFMRKPEPGVRLVAEARVLKLGRVLAVGDVLLRSDGSDAVIARASLTYSIPPKGMR